VRDKLVYRDVDSRAGNYAPIEYGTAHPDTTRYPGYVLVYQKALKEDDTTVRRFYAAPRLNQDDYNFSIDYPHGDTAYPQYVRTYVLPRDGYVVVAPGTADPVVATLGLIKQEHGRSDDIQIDTYFVIVRRTYGRLPTPWLSGQEYDPTFDFSAATFQSRFEAAGTSVGDADSRIETIDTIQQKRSVFTPNHADIAAYSKIYASTHNLDLPDVLNSIDMVWEQSGGGGVYNETGDGASVGNPAQLQMSLRGTASGTGTVMPQLLYDIDTPDGSGVPTTDYFFFLTNPTEAAILSKLNSLTGGSVVRWPRFHAKRHTLILKGQKVALALNVSAQCMVYINSTGQSYTVSEGTGGEVDVSSSIVRIDLPPTIHGAISVGGDLTKSVTIICTAEAGTSAGSNWPGASASITDSIEGNGSVTPTSFAATTPAVIPTSGLYLVSTEFNTYRYGYIAVMARVLNASVLA
jgi:hypothetical protein